MNPEAYIEMDKTESTHWWFSGRRTILQQTLRSLQLPKNSQILEIGCGTGGNLQMLSQFGTVSGIEINDDAREIASKKTNYAYDIKAGHCPDNIPFTNQRFDLICLFDVLEHIEDETETLIIIKNLLNTNGKIILTLPAYKWLWSPHDEFLHHKRRYSLKMLHDKITTARLVPEKISYFNTILFPLAAIIKLKDNLFSKKSGTGTKVPSLIINNIFRIIFSCERFFLKHYNFPFGVSLLCILTKNETR